VSVTRNVLDGLIFGVRFILAAGQDVAERNKLNFAAPFAVVDNTTEKRTDVSIANASSSASGLLPQTTGANKVLITSSGNAPIWSSSLVLGTNPSTTGTIATQNACSWWARNSGNTDNVRLIDFASSTLQIGQTASLTLSLHASTTVSLLIGGNARLTVADAVATLSLTTFQFERGVASPVIAQETDTAGSATGDTLTIQAQSCSGATSTGGDLVHKAGTGTSASGKQRFKNAAGTADRLVCEDNGVSINGAGSFGGGVGVLGVLNATTVPNTNPTGGGVLYAEAGAGKWRGSGGTVTTFGPAEPHCPTCGRDCAHEWSNDAEGWHLSVCMWCLTDALGGLGVIRKEQCDGHS